ncbi:MAG: sensor histidine kinase [Salibacteraceae bacterium]
MRNLLVFFCCLSCPFLLFAQANEEQISDSKRFAQALRLINLQQLDSARSVLQQMSPEVRDQDFHSIMAITKPESASYSDFKTFLLLQGNLTATETTSMTEFVLQHVKTPVDETFNYDYAVIGWMLTTTMRNVGDMDGANHVFEEQLKYYERFDPNEQNVVKAGILMDFHRIVMALIQRDAEKGMSLSQDCIERSKAVNDTNLIIGSLYHQSDFLAAMRRLDDYIKISEEIYELDKDRPKKSTYFESNLVHLINGYSFKGGFEDKVWDLLQTIYSVRASRSSSYSLFAQFYGDLPAENHYKQKILDFFNVDNLQEFEVELKQLAKPVLDNNNYYHVLNELSQAMAAEGFVDDAMRLKSECINLIQETYSEDLAQSLASFQTREAVKLKEVEIENEREKANLERDKANLYTVIAALAGLLLVLVIVILVRKSRQAKALTESSEQLRLQRDEITEREAEKALLLKEVHHRVKNNFQIVSSLLELQSKGIEDEKARELAEEGKNRVKSMALIHQRLYQNDDLLIYFDEYIDKLVKEISAMYGTKENTEIDLKVPKLGFDVDTAIPLGLIVNELVTNAFKYGFSDTQQQLKISLDQSENDLYRLTVKDNGAGLAPGFDVTKARSLGLRLVRRLSKQLQGKVDYQHNGGAVFTVFFKDTNARAEVA